MGRGTAFSMSFTADIKIGETPLVVQFTDTTSNAISWDWNFGDGTASEEQNPQHTYYLEGVYTVTLVATFADLSQETTTFVNFIISIPGETTSEENCLRLSTEANEGKGWSLLSGDHFVVPADNYGAFKILDSNNADRVIVFDKSDFRVYEIDTSDKIINDRPAAVDKETIQNSEISWEKWEPESVFDITEEHKFILHDRSFINTRPDDPRNRGAVGYTNSGLRNAQKLTLEAYVDGEQVLAGATAENFPEGAEVVMTGQKIKGNRVQLVVKGTASEITLLNFIHYFLGSDEAKETALRTMTKHTLQRELSTGLVLHISRGLNKLLNRVTGVSIGSGTGIEGPDGKGSSGVSTSNQVVCDNESVETDYTVIIWIKSGTGFGGVTYSSQGTSGNWNMLYAKGSIGLAANMTLPAGEYFDIRIYNKLIGADTLEYLYNDIISGGKALLPT